MSIAECKPSRTKGKNISVLKQSTSLLSHLFSSLQSRPNADIADLCYLRIKRSHHHYQTEGQRGGTKSDILECLETSSCDVSMEIADAAAIVHMFRTIKVASFQQYVERHFLTFVQSMISDDIGVHNNQT